jgi:hypothetical protein
MKINVRVVRAGVAGASGWLALGGAAGCSSPEGFEGNEHLASHTQALATTPVSAGSARLELTNWWTAEGSSYALTLRDSTTDEFVRVGESLTVSLPGYLVWGLLNPASELPEISRFRRISAKVTAVYTDVRSGKVTTETVAATEWRGENYWDAYLDTEAFTVAKRTDSLAFDIELTDLGPEAGSTPVTATISREQFQKVVVFGGDLPNKTVLLDTEGSTKRTRILEGDALGAGGNATIAYTDWRADTIIDASSIDKQIGTVKSYGRFGPYIMPIYGEIEYEITAGYAFDDGSWSEDALALVTASALVGPYRKDYEARLALPSSARSMSLYFHVKAFLKIDYSRWPGAERWYEEGRRAVADRYDNPQGAFTNYELPIAAAAH